MKKGRNQLEHEGRRRPRKKEEWSRTPGNVIYLFTIRSFKKKGNGGELFNGYNKK